MKTARPRLRHRMLLAVTAVGGIGVSSSPAWAIGSTWTFNGSGNWSLASNWLGGVPVATSDVVISHADALNRTINYDYTGGSIQLNSLLVQNTGGGSSLFSQSANSLSVINESVGSVSGSTGYWSLSGTAVHNVANTGSGLFFGNGTASTGVGSILGGTLNLPAVQMYVGYYGQAAITQSGGIQNSAILTMGWQPSGSGTYNLSGGTINNTGGLYVGYQGNGTMNMTGGVINAAAANENLAGDGATGNFIQSGGVNTVGTAPSSRNVYVGYGTGGTGTYTLSGTGSFLVFGSAYLGGSTIMPIGSGVLNVSGGSMRVSDTLKLWNGFNSAINFSGGTLTVGTLDTSGAPNRFNWSAGTLNIFGPPTAVLAIDNTGTAALGASLSLTPAKALVVQSAIQVGSIGSGSVAQSGGLLVTNSLQLASNPGSTGLYNMNGGTVSAFVAIVVGGLNGAAVGTFNQSNGFASMSALNLAFTPGSSGLYSLSGGSLSATGAFIGGHNVAVPGGTGVFNISGGTASFTGTVKLFDTGPAAPAGTGANLVGGTLNVGSIDVSGNPARFNFSSGTLNLSGPLSMGPDGPFVGTVDLTPFKSLIVGGTTSGHFNAPIVLDGGLFSTGSLTGGNAFAFNSGTFRLTNASLTIDSSGLLGSTVQLNSNQRLEVGGANTLTVGTGGLLYLTGGTALAGNAVVNNGQVELASPTALLGAGSFLNNGVLTGTGRIAATLFQASLGSTRVSANDWLTLLGIGLNNSNGSIILSGGGVEFTGAFTNNNVGLISGRGTLIASGGLTNDGSMQFSGGITDDYGAVTNNGRIIITAESATTFYGPLNTSAGSITVSANCAAAFLGTVSGVSKISGAGTKDYESTASGGPIVSKGLTIVGPGGNLTADAIHENSLSVYGTTLIPAKATANSPSGTSQVQSLLIADGGRLDLTNNSMIIDYSGAVGSLVDDVRQDLRSARLRSTLADAAHALGYADNLTLGLASFSGQAVDTTSILIKYTYAGDANLDGKVDVTDLGALATRWQTAAVWTGGDFNYDGFVDVSDLGALATNWQAGVGNPLGPGSFEAALAGVGLGGLTVPEPPELFLASATIAGLAFFRRRKGWKIGMAGLRPSLRTGG